MKTMETTQQELPQEAKKAFLENHPHVLFFYLQLQ